MSNYYFDTYALFEIIKGNPNFNRFKGIPAITSRLNLYELHFGILIRQGLDDANICYNEFLQYSVGFDDETIKNASIFRAINKKLNLSYVDCLGYCIALERKAKFLTGDEGFRNLPNVEFVK